MEETKYYYFNKKTMSFSSIRENEEDKEFSIEEVETILKEINNSNNTKTLGTNENGYPVVISFNNEILIENLRNKRAPLLLAFDKWEKAVIRGREEDSVEIMQWYQDLLDLVESAFENVPDRINYYM